MIKKITFIILWTLVLPICATAVAAILAAVYSRAVIHMTGALPSDAARHTMQLIWTYAGEGMVPVALLLGTFGLLPGTRLRKKNQVALES